MHWHKLDEIKDKLRQPHWRWAGYGVGGLLALIVLIMGISLFSSDRAEKLRGTEQARKSLRLAAQSLATYGGDRDGDGVAEPTAPSDLQGNVGAARGQFVPARLGVERGNAGGLPFLYCAWDYGRVMNPALYRVPVETMATPAPNTVAIALIDPGQNGQYETRCEDAMLQQKRGDDLIETVDLATLAEMGTQKVGGARKGSLTCAFGQIYAWNGLRGEWQCQNPSPEQAVNIPAGCPTGQVLVERNNRIKCESQTAFVGTEDAPAPVNLPAAPQQAPAVAQEAAPSPQVSMPAPMNNNPAPNLPNAPANSAPQAAQAASGTYMAQPTAPNAVPAPQAAASPNLLMQQPQAQPLSAPQSAAIQSERELTQLNALAQTARGQNLLQSTAPPERQTYRAPEPGENFASVEAEAAPVRGANLLQENNNAAAEPESAIEMEIKRRQRTYKMKACTNWTYLPRSVGPVNQCVRVNRFGDALGASAKMTSWPSAKSFLPAAFMFCPVGEPGEKPPCRPIALDANQFTTATKPSVFDAMDGFFCARLYNPLAAPWPQFESFIYSEEVPGTGKCAIDHLPMFDKRGGTRQLLCLSAADMVESFRQDGYCGCGWSMIWNAELGRFVCS